jgi:hypothetical protein
MPRWFNATLSLCVPGGGQILAGRLLEGALLLLACAWVRLVMGGVGWTVGGAGDAEAAFWFGAFGIEGGGPPLAWLFTAALFACHLHAARDAW